MKYEPHEKLIYSPPGSTEKYDPLVLDRSIMIASGGKINEMMVAWYGAGDDLGDISEGGKPNKLIMSAQAEEQLAKVSRKVFNLPDFPACLDAIALEFIDHFLRYMEGKGNADGKPQ